MVVERVLLGISDLARVEVLAASELVVRPPGGEPGVLTSAQWTALRDLLQGVAVASSGAGRVWNRPPLSLPMRRLLRTYAFDPTSTRLSGEYPDRGRAVRGVAAAVDRWVSWSRWSISTPPGSAGTSWSTSTIRPSSPAAACGGRATTPGRSTGRLRGVDERARAASSGFVGRPFRAAGHRAVEVVPHAFEGRNAFFDPEREAVLFGYYRADSVDPGRTCPSR